MLDIKKIIPGRKIKAKLKICVFLHKHIIWVLLKNSFLPQNSLPRYKIRHMFPRLLPTYHNVQDLGMIQHYLQSV